MNTAGIHRLLTSHSGFLRVWWCEGWEWDNSWDADRYGGTYRGEAIKFLNDTAARLGVSQEFLKFLLVGGFAFIVNQAALYGLYDSPMAAALPDKDTRIDFGLIAHPDARLLIASGLAVEVAIVFKFLWSEGWIFRHRRSERGVVSRFMHFNVSCAASSVLTVAVTNVVTPVFGISPYISTAIGVLCGFMLNWVWAARLVWPEKRAAAAAD